MRCCLTLGFHAHSAVSQLPLPATTAADHPFFGAQPRSISLSQFRLSGKVATIGHRQVASGPIFVAPVCSSGFLHQCGLTRRSSRPPSAAAELQR